jgi:hypothetical protein
MTHHHLARRTRATPAARRAGRTSRGSINVSGRSCAATCRASAAAGRCARVNHAMHVQPPLNIPSLPAGPLHQQSAAPTIHTQLPFAQNLLQQLGDGDREAACSRIVSILKVKDSAFIDSDIPGSACTKCKYRIGAYAYQKDSSHFICHICGDETQGNLIRTWSDE